MVSPAPHLAPRSHNPPLLEVTLLDVVCQGDRNATSPDLNGCSVITGNLNLNAAVGNVSLPLLSDVKGMLEVKVQTQEYSHVSHLSVCVAALLSSNMVKVYCFSLVHFCRFRTTLPSLPHSLLVFVLVVSSHAIRPPPSPPYSFYFPFLPRFRYHLPRKKWR